IGEVSRIDMVPAKDTIGTTPDGLIFNPYSARNCNLPPDAAGYHTANDAQTQSTVLVHAYDTDGTQITGAFIYWQSDSLATDATANTHAHPDSVRHRHRDDDEHANRDSHDRRRRPDRRRSALAADMPARRNGAQRRHRVRMREPRSHELRRRDESGQPRRPPH